MAPSINANGTKRVRPGRRLSLRQVTDFQDIAHQLAQGLQKDFLASSNGDDRARVASAFANVGKTWVSLQDSKREILGKPKAGVLKPDRRERASGNRGYAMGALPVEEAPPAAA